MRRARTSSGRPRTEERTGATTMADKSKEQEQKKGGGEEYDEQPKEIPEGGEYLHVDNPKRGVGSIGNPTKPFKNI